MAATDLFAFDPTLPVYGGRVKSSELRRNLGMLATHLRSPTENRTPAQLAGDRRWTTGGTQDLSSGKFLRITTNTSSSVVTNLTFDVDCSTGGASPANARTLADVITTINTAYTGAGGSGTLAYQLDGFVLLKSPYAGANSIVKVDTYTNNLDTPTNKFDGLEQILALSKRESGPPYTYRGSDPLDGALWNVAADAATFEQEIKFRNRGPAQILGPVLAATIDLTGRNGLHFKIKAKDTTEVDVPIALVNGSMVRSAIPSTINTFCRTAFTVSGFPQYQTATFASLTADNRLLVQVPGPSTDPFGGTAYISIAMVQNDASSVLLGVNTGLINLDEYDHALTGTIMIEDHQAFRPWTQAAPEWVPLLRGVDRWAGIGLYGPPVDSSQLLPATGLADGEVRYARDTGIPWAWNVRRTGIAATPAWKRAIPDGFRHIKYVPEREAYRLRTTLDYNPSGLVKGTTGSYDHYFSTSGPNSTTAALHISDIPELIDAKDSRFFGTFSGTFNSFGVHGTGVRDLYRAPDLKDDFKNRASTTQPSLGSSADSVAWTTGSSQGGTFGARVNNNRIELAPSDCISGVADAFAAYLYQNNVTSVGGFPTAAMMVAISARMSGDNQVGDNDSNGTQPLLYKTGCGVLLGGVLNGTEVDHAIFVLVTHGNGKVPTDPTYVVPTGRLIWGTVGPNGSGGLALNVLGTQDTEALNSARGQVLRASLSGSTTPTLKVWWRSSTDPTRWEQDETPILTTTIAGTWGTLAGVILGNHITQTVTSIVDKFIVREQVSGTMPGLPEVSGARLRDLITSLRVGTTWTAPSSGIVNDCTPEFPCEFVAGPGILIEQDTTNRRFRWSTTDTGGGGGGGGTGGGPGGAGGGDPPPPPPPPPFDPSGPTYNYVSYPGTMICTGDRSFTTLWNVNLGDAINKRDPFLSMSPIDFLWNTNYLDNLNLRPTDWLTQPRRSQILDLTTYNSAEYGKSGKTAPPAHSTFGGTDWGATTAISSMIRQLVALSIDPVTGTKPSWLNGVTGTSLDTVRPYTTTGSAQSLGPTPYWVTPVATAIDLPRVAPGSGWFGLHPPSGVTALVLNEKRVYVYDAATNVWTPVNAQNAYSSLSLQDANGNSFTLNAGNPGSSFTLKGTTTNVTFSSGGSGIINMAVSGGGGSGFDVSKYLDTAVQNGTAVSGSTAINNVGQLVFNDSAFATADGGPYSADGDRVLLVDGPLKTVSSGSGSSLYERTKTKDLTWGGAGPFDASTSFSHVLNPSRYFGTDTNPTTWLGKNGRLVLSSSDAANPAGIVPGYARVYIEPWLRSTHSTQQAAVAIAAINNTDPTTINFLNRDSANSLKERWQINVYNELSTGRQSTFEITDVQNNASPLIQLFPKDSTSPFKGSAVFSGGGVFASAVASGSFVQGTQLVATGNTIGNGTVTRTISGLFDTTTNNADAIADGTNKVLMLSTERTKLATVEDCANVNPHVSLGGTVLQDGKTLDQINFINTTSATWTVTPVNIGTNSFRVDVSVAASGGGGGTLAVQETGGGSFSNITTLEFGTQGLNVSNPLAGKATVNVDAGTGLTFAANQLVADVGSTSGQVAAGSHKHNTGGYTAVDFATDVTNKSHALDPAAGIHTGNLPAKHVLVTSSFDSATQYSLGTATGGGPVIFIGRNASGPLCNESASRIFSHTHAGVGTGGQISYADLSNKPPSFNPDPHAASHLSGGSDQINGESLAVTLTPGGYTATAATMTGQLTGVSNQLVGQSYSYVTCSMPVSLSTSDTALYVLGSPTNGTNIPSGGKPVRLVEATLTLMAGLTSGQAVTVTFRNLTALTTATLTLVGAGSPVTFSTAALNLLFSSPTAKLAVSVSNDGSAATIRGGTITMKFQAQP